MANETHIVSKSDKQKKNVVEKIKLTLDFPLLVSPMTAIIGRSM